MVKYFIFPIADGTAKIVLKRSRRQKIPSYAGPTCKEFRGDLQGSSERSQPQDETEDDAEARDDFWSVEGSSFIVITSNLEFSSVCRKKKHSHSH